MDTLSWIYQVWFRPGEAFEAVLESSSQAKEGLLLMACFLVAIISALGVVHLSCISSLMDLVGWMLLATISGLLVWLMTSAVYALTASIFGIKEKALTLFILTAFSLLPWLFLPLILNLKHLLGFMGGVVGSLGFLVIWVWSTCLFIKALRVTYTLSLTQAFFAVCIPLLMSMVGALWNISFFWNMVQLFC